MKKRFDYVAPATSIHRLSVRHSLLNGSPKANYMANPGVGDPDGDDAIGTESRMYNNAWTDDDEE